MDEKLRKVYEPSKLAGYPLKQRLAIRFAAFGFWLLITLIGKTLRFENVGEEHPEAIKRDGRTPIYTIWHDRIFLGTYHLRDHGLVVITSQSFDGEYIARFLTFFGFGTVRGSSTRGGTGALVEMIRLMRRGIPTAFTIDGPKGPRHVAKAGACLLAKKTGDPILPLSFDAARFWTLKSWDKLQIPKPFSRARLVYSEPIYVDANADDAEIEKTRELVQQKLDELDESAKQWRNSF